MKKIFGPALALVFFGAVAAYHWKPSQWKDVFVMPFHKDEKTAQLFLKEGNLCAILHKRSPKKNSLPTVAICCIGSAGRAPIVRFAPGDITYLPALPGMLLNS